MLTVLIIVLIGFVGSAAAQTSQPADSVVVGDGPFGLEVTPDGAFAIVTLLFPELETDPNVVIVDLKTFAVTDSFRVGRRLFEMAIVPRPSALSVSSYPAALTDFTALGVFGDQNFASVIDLISGAEVGRVDAGSRPSGITGFVPSGGLPAAGPLALSGASAIVTNGTSGDLTFIDADTLTVINPSVEVGRDPRDVAVHPGGRYGYVALGGEKVVAVIDLDTFSEVSRISVGKDPVDVEFTPQGDRAVVANLTNNTVTILNTANAASPSLVRTPSGTPQVPVGVQPTSIAITPDGETAFVANQGSNFVSAVNIDGATLDGVITVQQADSAIAAAISNVAVSPSGDRLLVVERGNGARMLAFDLAGIVLEEAPVIDIPGEPRADIFLDTDPSLGCPGFYIAGVDLLEGAGEGTFGMEILTTAGNRLLQGGINLGGAFEEDGRSSGFGAFNIANRGNEPQNVNLEVAAQALTTPGFDAAALALSVQVLDSSRNPVGDPASGAPPLQLSVTLDPGFYIVRIQSLAGSPRGSFQMALATSFTDRAGGGFQGGVNVGGFITRRDDGSSLTGFAAFCISDAQTIRLRTEGSSTRGASGSGDLVMTIKDRNRDVVRTVNNSVAPPPEVALPSAPSLDGITPTLYVDASAPAGGDGSQQNPFNSITEAVGKAAQANDVILVLPGVYSPSTTGETLPIGSPGVGLNRIPEGAQVLGSGADVTIVDAEGVTREGGNLNAFGVGSDNVRIAGLTVRGATGPAISILNADAVVIDRNFLTGSSRGVSAQNAAGLIVEQNVVVANDETGIAVSASPTRLTTAAPAGCPASFGACVTGNTSNDHRADGILVSQGGEYYILDNQCFNNGVSGIELNNGATPGAPPHPELRGWVRNNTTNNNGGVQFAFAGTGILVTEFAHAEEITDNEVLNNRPGGIAIFEDATANRIARNNISDNAQNALAVQKRSTATQISDNLVTNNGLAGLFVENESSVTTISNNDSSGNGTCTECTSAKGGLAVLGDSSVGTVSDGSFDRNAVGMQVATNSRIDMVTGSTFDSNDSAGIFVRINSSLVDFSNNKVRRNRGQGGLLISESTGAINNSEISDNETAGISFFLGSTFTLSGTTVDDNGTPGVAIFDASLVTLLNCQANGNGEEGVLATGSGSTGNLEGCTIQNNVGFGLNAQNGGLITCTGSNAISGNQAGQVLGNTSGCQ